MIYVIRRMLAEEGDVGKAVDRILGRGARRQRAWAGGSPARPGPVGPGPIGPTGPGADGQYRP